MSCQFILFKVDQLFVYVYLLFFGFLPHLGRQRALSRVPCAIQQVLISHLFHTQYQQCEYIIPRLPVLPNTLLYPLGVHVLVLDICVSVSVWQIRSSIPRLLLFNDTFYLNMELHTFAVVAVQSLNHVSLQLHGLQNTRLPCSLLPPGVCSNSHPLRR